MQKFTDTAWPAMADEKRRRIWATSSLKDIVSIYSIYGSRVVRKTINLLLMVPPVKFVDPVGTKIF